jgi:hypothetical protein
VQYVDVCGDQITVQNFTTKISRQKARHKRCHNPEDHNLRFCGNLKTYIAHTSDLLWERWGLSLFQSNRCAVRVGLSKPIFGFKSSWRTSTGAYDQSSIITGLLMQRKDGSEVCICCWPSSAQPLSGSSTAGLMTIFYCLKFETPATWRASFTYWYYLGAGWPSYAPKSLWKAVGVVRHKFPHCCTCIRSRR